ncbi:MAG: radical SAM protein [Acidobacteria bacterium]|nr:radical SAM protein [Acidobacteriota bacterium]
MQLTRKLRRKARQSRLIIAGVLSRHRPLLAHVIPTRRCNLSCSYCNEYDDHSSPVPLNLMLGRMDRLAELGVMVVIMSGGEPLLHPDAEKIIERVRRHKMIAGLITNGYLLTAERIESLNRAGLEYLQISIDNVKPDEVSVKSLKVLDKKLQLLREHAEFEVNINSVLGGGFRNPEDAVSISRRAVKLGFTSTLGIIHDGTGHLRPLQPEEKAIFDALRKVGKRHYARLNRFQENLALGKPNEWRCRAGARYLYVCENGLVHYCSQQRGYPGIPLERYTREDIRREYTTRKTCAPYCTVACVHQISLFDSWRAPQHSPARPFADPRVKGPSRFPAGEPGRTELQRS